LKFSEFLSFSLLEVWLISISCDFSDEKIITMTDKVRKCLKDENYGNFVDEILPLMDLYGEKFASKIPKKQKKNIDIKYEKNIIETIQADLMARKSFFLFLYTLDANHVEILRNLAEELQEYIRTYID
jgi:hypothetical protein